MIVTKKIRLFIVDNKMIMLMIASECDVGDYHINSNDRMVKSHSFNHRSTGALLHAFIDNNNSVITLISSLTVRLGRQT